MDRRLEALIRNIPDFPKPGIRHKDITPLGTEIVGCAFVVELDELKG